MRRAGPTVFSGVLRELTRFSLCSAPSPLAAARAGSTSVTPGITRSPTESRSASAAPQAGQLVASAGAAAEHQGQDRDAVALGLAVRPFAFRHHSHSIVAGGLELMSYTTRLTPRTSLTMRALIRPNTSYGSLAQSAVIPSSDVTARTATRFA